MTALLRAESLRIGYRRRRQVHTVLDGLGLELRAGQLVCLLGRNGSGKSTLLRTLAGMQRPLHGRVWLHDDDIGALPAVERARRLAVVLTDAVDVGLMRARDLVALGRHPYTGWDGRLSATDREAVAWALHAAGATELADRAVPELSDGERQRVLIARALAQQPSVLALDEPVAFVDVARRVELVHLLRTLARRDGLAVLLTTHDLDLAVRSADVLWLLEPLEDGPAAVHVGAPEDLVLSGAVARAFDSDEVEFDLARGSFVPLTAGVALARVVGEGPAATWATRALERADLAVVDTDDADVTVEVLPGPAWRLHTRGVASRHATIGDLLAALAAGDAAGVASRKSHAKPPHPVAPLRQNPAG